MAPRTPQLPPKRPQKAPRDFQEAPKRQPKGLQEAPKSSLTDDSWAQAQLNLNEGGLGLRSAEKHSPAAYLSSRAKSSELCRS
eukprot:9452542-Pyramimonas_sp.AAC.1